MIYKRLAKANPFGSRGSRQKAAVGGSKDFYGASSLEQFSSVSGLDYTHEDAQGFLDYPTSFAGNEANFWLKDSGVKVWGYEESYDNWQDTYGMDSVMVFYHSGHGDMASNGVFAAPLGAKWDGRDEAFSNMMSFGDEELRYLFWSTCLSLRISGRHTPVRSWWGPDRGLRMLFGYETTSIDDPNYGKFFWEEWKKGKAFAGAFLDASWRISHNQVPVVLAVGANQTEALNRLSNERIFSRTPAAKGWYEWQWVGMAGGRAPRYPKSAPKGKRALILGNRYAKDEGVARIARIAGLAHREAQTIYFDEAGNRVLASKKVRVHVNREGSLSIHFGSPNMHSRKAIAEAKAIRTAKSCIHGLGLGKEVDLSLGHLRRRFSCGGTLNGSGAREEPCVVETIVQFRQSHAGVDSVNSDHGLIAVHVDNDAKVTHVYDTTRPVLGETEKPRSVVRSPPDRKRAANHDAEKQFRQRIHRILARQRNGARESRAAGTSKVLFERVGYDLSGNLGLVVRQKIVELTVGTAFKKRYKLRVPIQG